MPRPGIETTLAVRQVVSLLTTLRLANGWSQEYVADRAGFSKKHLGEIERHQTGVYSETLDAIAAVFGLTLTVAPLSTSLIDTTADMGAEIRRLRKQAGLTLEDVGAAAGIAPTNLSSYENDRRRPDPETLLRIVAALGCRLVIVGAP